MSDNDPEDYEFYDDGYTPESLQEYCLKNISEYYYELPSGFLNLLPAPLVKDILSRLPLIDLFQFDRSTFPACVDFDEFWRFLDNEYLMKCYKDVFYFETQEWLKELGIVQSTKEFYLAFLSNCAITLREYDLNFYIKLLLVQREAIFNVLNFVSICSNEDLLFKTAPSLQGITNKTERVFLAGKKFAVPIPKPYAHYFESFSQWKSRSLLGVVLRDDAKYFPQVLCIAERVSSIDQLTAIIKWEGLGSFLSCVKALYLSLSLTTDSLDFFDHTDQVKTWAPFLLNTLLSHSPLCSLHITGTQEALDNLFGYLENIEMQHLELSSIDITSEKSSGTQIDSKLRVNSMMMLASLLERSRSTLTNLHLSFKCVQSIEVCRKLGTTLATTALLPNMRIISLHQISILPIDLFRILHSFLACRLKACRLKQKMTMQLSELSVVDSKVLSKALTLNQPLPLSTTFCPSCPSLKYLTVLSTNLSQGILLLLVNHAHLHFKELHLDDVHLGSLDEIGAFCSSPNLQCERLTLESTKHFYSPISIRSLLKNPTLQVLEVSEVDDSHFLEDVTCGLQNQSSLGMLTELSLVSCKIVQKESRRTEDMRMFFTALFNLPQLEDFALKLQYLQLESSDIHTMLETWRALESTNKQLKSLTIIDSCCTENFISDVEKLAKHLTFRCSHTT